MYNRSLHFHFVGIGGSGMSGIAEILLNNGFRVSGSDISFSQTCERLALLGAHIFQGHSSQNVPPEASLLVYSSAVNPDNPELQEGLRRGLPVVKRAEVLAELMRLKFGVAVAGAHGKTTTTSMIGWLLETAELDPTVVIGGQVRKNLTGALSGSGGRSGKGEFLVAEADESDRSFLLLKPTVALVTNVDREHMNAYGSVADLQDAFKQFIYSVPFYGLAVLCIDDPFLREVARDFPRRSITYGFSDDAELRGKVHEVSEQGVDLEVYRKGSFLLRLRLPLLGRHLAQNALGAIAVALEFGLHERQIIAGLESFPGVERRLERVGTIGQVTIFNDYGHHPVEIAATLRALRESYRATQPKLIVVFQPHRYSRTRDSYKEFCCCFEDCDAVWITSIYPAGEPEIAGISGAGLSRDLKHPNSRYLGSLEDNLLEVLDSLDGPTNLLFLGAGSVGKNSAALSEKIEKLMSDEMASKNEARRTFEQNSFHISKVANSQ